MMDGGDRYSDEHQHVECGVWSLEHFSFMKSASYQHLVETLVLFGCFVTVCTM